MHFRAVAQGFSVLVWGTRGRRFKSVQPDNPVRNYSLQDFFVPKWIAQNSIEDFLNFLHCLSRGWRKACIQTLQSILETARNMAKANTSDFETLILANV